MQLASFDAKLAATATTEEATFAIYETNFYVRDSREIHDFYGTSLRGTTGKSK
jgi:hypothetical protein